MTKDFSTHYADIASIYDKIRIDMDDEVVDLNNYILEQATSREPAMLDIGCGPGRYSKRLLESNIDVMGIDLSEVNIQQCNHENYIVGDFLTHDFKHKKFDILIAVHMLQQLSNEKQSEFFSRIPELLVEEGVLVIKTALFDDIENRIVSKFFPSSIEINKSRYPDIDKFAYLCKNNGLRIKEVLHRRFKRQLSKYELLERFTKKYNTTLHLIETSEFEEGLDHLKYSSKKIYDFYNSCHYIRIKLD